MPIGMPVIPNPPSVSAPAEYADYWILTNYQRHCLVTTNFWRVKEGQEPIAIPPGEEDKINSGYYLNPLVAKPKFDLIENCYTELKPFPPPVPQPRFSFFNPPITNTLPARTLTLAECAEMIKYPYPYDKNTANLRALQTVEARKAYKARHLAYVTFSGIFSRRDVKSLKSHSGLITIDLDHIENPEEVKQQLRLDCELVVAMIYISPSGDGLKVIVPIDITAGSHSDYFDAIAAYLLKTYDLRADPSGRDVARACFLCHDIKLYLNPNYR